MDNLSTQARNALSRCLGLGPEESLLVVCDPPCEEVGRAFFIAGREMCREAVLVEMTPRAQSGNEPPQQVGEMFSRFDVAVMPTSTSLSHTRARRLASEQGTRIATLPGITAEMFTRTMQADWDALKTRTDLLARDLCSARHVQIETAAGTALHFETGGRRAESDTGVLTAKKAFGNLPAGEAYLAPLEGTAEGRLVIDGSFPLCGILDKPLVLDIAGGEVRRAGGHSCASALERIFDDYGRAARNIAEFGVGSLETARISGNVLEDEKVAGTIHIAVGDNASMGGSVTVAVHLDGVVRQPTVWLDGTVWLRDGRRVEP